MRWNDRPTRPEEEFAAWLDDLVCGQETGQADAGSRASDLTQIEATARRVQRLGMRAQLTAAERNRIREDVMVTANQPTDRVPVLVPGTRRRGRHEQVGHSGGTAEPRIWRQRPRLSAVVSGALVAILLAAIVVGYRSIGGTFGPWHENDHSANTAAPLAAMSTPALPDPSKCTMRDVTEAEVQKILMAPYEQRTNALPKKPVPVDAVDGGQILQAYEQIRACTINPSVGETSLPPLSTHALQELYWRADSLSGLYDTRTTEPGSSPATPPLFPVGSANAYGTPVAQSPYVWQPDISKTDTYFAELNVSRVEMMKDGRVLAWITWSNQEGMQPKIKPPLTALAFIKVNGQWKLDDWIFGTQILTDAGR